MEHCNATTLYVLDLTRRSLVYLITHILEGSQNIGECSDLAPPKHPTTAHRRTARQCHTARQRHSSSPAAPAVYSLPMAIQLATAAKLAHGHTTYPRPHSSPTAT